MVDREVLDKVYKQNLEESIIAYLAEEKKMELADAMDAYYKSKLAVQIQKSACGIENMDYKYLVNDLIVNEPELFKENYVAESSLTDSLTEILSDNNSINQMRENHLKEKY